ncbi:MAG: ABC transporter ATP-binding protein [Pseudomonadota bacterium]
MALLEIKGTCKTHPGPEPNPPTLDNINLELAKGDILCLLGHSGCGKTTLLRIIAGLEKADRGSIFLEGRDVRPIPPHRRDFGLMFQEFSLFPHRNVLENVAFGLEMKKLPPNRIQSIAGSMLDLVGLSGFAKRRVDELSGGERQRVALARSLAPSPRLLMLDEPLGALDRALRERLMPEIRQILKNVGMTAIFVTHDQAEAFAVADEIAVMDQGRVRQVAGPEELYRQPSDVKVAEFLGFQNIFSASAAAGGLLETAVGIFKSPRPEASGKMKILIRPEGARLASPDERPGEDETAVVGRVLERRFQGRSYYVGIECPSGDRLAFEPPNHVPPPRLGERAAFLVRSSAVVILPES